jgi:hypothetical protein
MTDRVPVARVILLCRFDAFDWIDESDHLLQNEHESCMRICGTHKGEVLVRHWLDTVFRDELIINLDRQFLVNVFVTQHARQSEHSGNVSIKSACYPKRSFALFSLDGIKLVDYVTMKSEPTASSQCNPKIRIARTKLCCALEEYYHETHRLDRCEISAFRDIDHLLASLIVVESGLNC